MSFLEVGKRYNPSVTHWPECTNYNYRAGAHELLIFLNEPSGSEVEAVKSGEANFVLVFKRNIIFLLYQFGDSIPWSDAPYSWHQMPERERLLPEEQAAPETRAVLSIVLVNAYDGIVKAIRAVSLSPRFTKLLHDAIREQAQMPWLPRDYDANLNHLYGKYSTPYSLLKAALVRTESGIL